MQRRGRYRDDYELSAKDAETLTEDRDVSVFFEQCVESLRARRPAAGPGAAPGAACAKLLLNAGARRANERGVTLNDLGIGADQVAGIIELRDRNEIGSSAADELFGLLCETDEPPRAVAETHGLLQVTDVGRLDGWCDEAVAAQPQAADDYRAGKDAALGRLVGEVMKISKGQAEAKQVRKKLSEKLRG